MAAVKKTVAKKTVVKKKTAPAKKTVAKKTTVAKKAAPAKKTVAKKAAPAKKTVAKKATPAKKTVAKKTPAKKTTVKASDRARIEAEIAAMPSSDAEQNPNQPVAVLVATATRIAALGRPERKKLTKMSSFSEWYEQRMPGAIELLTTAEARWNSLRAASRAGTTVKALKEATTIKSEVFEGLRYLLRHDAEVQQELDQIQEGSGTADTAEDLRALYEICIEHKTVLSTDETFPLDQVEQMPILATTLLEGIDPATAAEAQAMRNRAFWYLLESVNELRAALRYLWRKQPPKLAMLGISYAARLQRNSRARRKAPLSTGGPAVQPA